MKVFGFPNLYAELTELPAETRQSHIDRLRRVAASEWGVPGSDVETKRITGENGFDAVEISLKKAA